MAHIDHHNFSAFAAHFQRIDDAFRYQEKHLPLDTKRFDAFLQMAAGHRIFFQIAVGNAEQHGQRRYHNAYCHSEGQIHHCR